MTVRQAAADKGQHLLGIQRAESALPIAVSAAVGQQDEEGHVGHRVHCSQGAQRNFLDSKIQRGETFPSYIFIHKSLVICEANRYSNLYSLT